MTKASDVTAANMWMFVSTPHVFSVEMAAALGFRGVILDDEKVHSGPDLMQAMIIAAERHGLSTLVRLGEPSQMRAEFFLSMGAEGLLLPRLGGLAEVETAIAWARFPPLGVRGLGHSRATGYGLDKPWAELIDPATHQPPRLELIVETAELLDCVEDAAALDGIDGLDIGLLDLSAALGYAGQTTAAPVQDAIDRVIRAGQAAGKPVGMSVGTPEAAASMLSRGLSMLVIDPAIVLKQGLQPYTEALTKSTQ